MKTLVCGLSLVFSLGTSAALIPDDPLEPIPAELIAKVGQRLADEAGKFDKPQVKIEPDVAKSNGLHKPAELGVLVMPQKDLKEGEELAAKFKTERGAPLALLFTYRLLPVIDGKLADASQFRQVSINDDEGNVHTINVLLLSVRQQGEQYHLYAWGHLDKPLIDAKFAQTGGGGGPEPVGLSVKDVDEQNRQGSLVVTVFGKYRASFRMGQKVE